MNNIDKIFNEINKHNKFNKSIRQCNKLITSYEYMNKFIQPIILFKEKIPKIPLLNFNKYKIQPIFNIKNQINQIFLPFNFNIDFDKSRKRFFLHEFKERKEIMSKFEQQNIFPPIMFLCEKEIYKIDKEILLEELIYNKELKQFYLNKINEWKDKFEDSIIDNFIEEIHFNLEHDNFYSVSSLIFILLEYLLRQGHEINSKGMYKHIKGILKSEVFEPIGIINLYYKFIQNNLYSNIDKAENFSRHALHGEKNRVFNCSNCL